LADQSNTDGVTPSASVNDLTPQNGRTDMASVKPVEEASQDFTAVLAAIRDDATGENVTSILTRRTERGPVERAVSREAFNLITRCGA
jgi:hypothetical protein